jgi:hypothetical protein
MGSVGLWFHFLTALEYVAEVVSPALFGLLFAAVVPQLPPEH